MRARPAPPAMDPLTVIGLALGLAAVVGGQWIEGGSPLALLQLAAFWIVIGGTAGAVMVQTPRDTFLHGLRLARGAFRPDEPDGAGAIAQIERWADVARREGLLALERQLDFARDPFTRAGLQLLVDGIEAARIREALEVDIACHEAREKEAARIWESAGGYAPTIGIIGAVLGLIHVMENLADPGTLGGGIAVAFVATIYGVGAANLVFLPIAGKLRARIDREVTHREMVMDGLLGIARGEFPRLIAARLRAYLPGERVLP